jgi:DNA mismatch repair protein MutS
MVKKTTPMQRQYLELKKQYKDYILLFRLGDFYEMFNEDAVKASKVLDIVLTSRGEGVSKWPMCGVPYHSVDGYIAKLLDAGHIVAIADQVEDASEAKGLVRRDIVRVITPGTILESTMLTEESNNYLVALIQHDEKVGLSAIDVSTGEFIATEFQGTLIDEKTINELGRLNPTELLLPDTQSKGNGICSIAGNMGIHVTFRNELDFSSRTGESRIKEQFNVTSLDGFGLGDKEVAVGAVGAILAYLNDVHKTGTVNVSSLRTYALGTHMVVDSTTQRNLELIKNARDGSSRGTLISVLSNTETPMGKRLLKKWILQPLMIIGDINERLDSVDELARTALMRQEIVGSLKNLGDFERTTSRIVFGTSNARDLLSLRDALKRLPKIKKTLSNCKSELLVSSGDSIKPIEALAKMLSEAILDNPPISVRDGGMIREGFDEELDKLKSSISSDKKWIASLQTRERRRSGIKSLRVGFNKVFGYYIEVTKSNLKLIPDDYERKQTLTNAERFITPELKEKEASVLAGEERINKLEYEIYERLRSQISDKAEELRTNSFAIAVIDVLGSLANVAVKRSYNRPVLTEGTRILIVDGRHPSMEMILGPREFVPNSLEIGDGGTSLLIVTGPNMAGKSTYMRQAALIVLMAQMGSFVPARNAEIGIVDRIFTRVGAFDDLTARQSTFMVEMLETANILNTATDRSFVILDEIGRGTSTYDGMALAWAVAEQIALMKTRTLFATHFHQLTEMAMTHHGIKNVHTLAKESGKSIVFLHKVVEGGTDKSYGVHVAALAGVPDDVVQRARQILQKLEKESAVRISDVESSDEVVQTSLEMLTIDDPILERIKHMDLERTTPIDALLELREAQDELKKREK